MADAISIRVARGQISGEGSNAEEAAESPATERGEQDNRSSKPVVSSTTERNQRFKGMGDTPAKPAGGGTSPSERTIGSGTSARP